jgi:hypothetical protein
LAKRLTLVARAVDMAREYLPFVMDGYAANKRSAREAAEAIVSEYDLSCEALRQRYEYSVGVARLAGLLGVQPHQAGETPDQTLSRQLRR